EGGKDKEYSITIAMWDRVAQQYEEIFMDLDMYNASYDVFCNAVKVSPAKILEIGCGPGNIARYMLSKRPDFKLNLSDVSPNMLQLARKNIPDAAFILLDARNIYQLNEKFDGIVCGFCIPYLSMKDVQRFFSDINRLFNDEGIFYFSLIEGDHSRSGFESSSDGKNKSFVYYYDEKFIRNELDKYQFGILDFQKIKYTKVNSEEMQQLIFTVKKKSVH
ncbi:MAG TPA: class I SAM-dependent methyltransferase, partial [Bacteroidia bacterium]|nr:class I SAM-dependent methyltransferase [Bacteroidia bacterium]